MHLPLLLVQDSILKTQTPWPKLSWIGENGRRVCSISQHLVREVDLSSGSCSKVAKLTPLTRTAAAINATFDGVFVYGILSSGDLFFWHTVTNQVWQAKGIPEVVTHTTNPPESNVVRDFLKQLLPQSFGSNISSDGADETTCSVPPHQRPKIFASSSCSKVVVVLGASQVYIWERSLGSRMEECPLSQHVPGSWSVAGCPGDIPLPSTHSKETQISCCFMYEENSEECHLSFTFVECLSVVVSTLAVSWRGSMLHPPAAHWNSHHVPFSSLGVKESELLHIKGTLISSYAHGQSLLAVAVNSCKQHSKLLYIHPLCNTAVTTNVQDAMPHLRSSNRNTVRSQWVSDLAWSHDSLYLFGCLMSGALFIATRMGPLIKISCQGEGIQLQAANILGMQPYSVMSTEEMGEEEGNKSPRGPPSITFCVSSHPCKHQVLLSSGLRVSVLSLPLDGRKEGEVVDCLLASTTHALHLLCNSAVTHDYAYIRDSTWRLAHSVLDLTQGLSNTSSPNPAKISLWDRRVVSAADKAGSLEKTPGDDGELMQIEQVMKPLMAAWTLIGSRSGPHTTEWRRRAGEVVVLVMRLVATLLHITTHDDHLEHQLQLLLVLNFYHRFMRVLCVWPNSFHMMKPALRLTHRLLHTVLACERHAGERSIVSTLLILTQTLSSVEYSLTQAFACRPALHLKVPSKAETVQVVGDVEVTDLVMSSTEDRIDNTVSLRMKKVWQCLHKNAKKAYTQLAEKKFHLESYQKSVLVLNILQSKLQNIGCDLSQRMVKLGKCHQLYLDGLYLKAIQAWKCEIITCLAKGHGKKEVARDLHSILYACFVHEGFLGISDFINWLHNLLVSLFCPKKQSSLPSSEKKFASPKKQSSLPSSGKKCATKAKSDEIRLPFENTEISQSPKINGKCEAVTKEDSQEKKVPEMRKLSHKEISSESRVYMFSPVGRTSSQEHVEVRTVSWIISATRQVMGSLGRILALEILGCCPDVPSPHKSHAIPPLWTFTTQPKGKAYQLSTMREGAAVSGEWSVDAAAQALALAGCWGDLAVFTSWLGDAKLALVAGVLASISDNKVPVPNAVLPLHQIKALLCQPTNSTAAEFRSHQELLQLAAMANLEILPVILEECLAEMKELTPLFETFVPSQIHLPAPPVFCPLGPQDGEELSLHVAADSSQSERRLRQEVAGWLRLVCQVTSAAGIAHPLLLSLQQRYSKLSQMGDEDLVCLMESLGCHQEHWQPQGPEWDRITQLWHEVITLVWVLYSRDKLSLGIRGLVKNASALRQNQELQETCILEILSWVHELNTLCEHDSWRTDLVACAMTAASEAPPVPAIASSLARVVPQPSEMSSLLRDKAARLFVSWKNTSIPVSEVEPCLEGKQNEREDISSPEIFTSLFSFYEDRCEEITKRISEEEKRGSSILINKYPAKSSFGTPVAARIQEEFGKFLILFVELTFMRDVQKFPQHTSPVPLLVQFSGLLRRRELEGIKVKNRFHHDDTGSIINSLKQNVLNSPCVTPMNTRSTVTTPEKKGLFRSLDHSKMFPRGSETIFISPVKRHVTSTPRNTPSVNKVLHNFEKENLKSKISNLSRRKLLSLYLQGRKSRSLSRQKKKSVSLPRPRSLSVSGGRRASHQRSSKQHSEPLSWKTSQSSSNVIKDLPIKRLLQLPQYLSYNTEQVEAEDTLRLLYWMMSQERQFSLPIVESDSYISGRLARKVDFTLDDVMLSLRWNNLLKSWSYINNEKSHPEMTKNRLKKKVKKEERMQRRTESVDVIPLNELVASDDHDGNVQVEVHQDTVISPIKQLDMNSVNLSNKDEEYIPEEVNGDEEDEQLYGEPDAESMSNSHLTERDQDREPENTENEQYDSEHESSLHLPCDLPDTKLKSNSVFHSNMINIQNHNKGIIMNSSEGGEKQGMGSGSKESSAMTDTQCEDQDPHQQNDSPAASQVTNPSRTFKENKESLKTSLVSYQAVELEQEGTNIDIRTRENNKMVTDQLNSRSEGTSIDVFKIRYKNQSKGHRVKVHAKEAKQSVPCRLPFLPAPQRVSNMTGIEAPEESSDPGIVPFGHLLHLPTETPSTSNMLRLADTQGGKNTTRVSSEDTLDNITLPDSLHASDLEEQSELNAPCQNIQDNIIKRNKYKPVGEKSKDGGTGLYVPLSVKKRITHGDPCRWDHGDLNLKPFALQAKSAHRDEISTSRSEKSMTHMKGNNNAKETLKLLTLPKLSPLKKCDTKQEKPLLLKQLPISSGYRDTAKDQTKNQNVSAWLHSKEGKVEHLRPLTIPKCFDSYSKDDGKTKALNFLNPHQVFAFYKQSVLKKHAEKFKSLKVSKKYIVPHEQPDAKPLVNIERKKERKKLDQQSLDKGFLDQVKDYADKYKRGDYENILRSNKEVGENEIVVHYKPINNKKKIDKSTQNDLHLTERSKPVENNQSSVDVRCGIGAEITHSGTLNKNLLRSKKEMENKSVNTDPYEMKQKMMSETGTQASNMEAGVLDGNTPSRLPSKSAAQTQTPTLQTVEASVLTDTVVSSKSESVQVNSLLPQSPSPLSHVEQAYPPPQSAALPPQPPASYTVSSNHSQIPSETGSAQGFVHIFDIPSEIVKEELKDIEMNRTIHSLDVEKGDQYAIQSFPNLDEKRKTGECHNQVTNKDCKEESLFQKQAEAQIMDGTTESNTRKHRLTKYTSQNLDKDKELSIDTPVSPIPSKIDINYENVTMDKLYEEFCVGRISLEDVYQMSTNIPEGEVKEETLHKTDKKESIQALEQQVLEAAQSISESQHLVEKVKCLIQEPEATESDRRTSQPFKSDEKFVSSFSHRHQNSLVMAKVAQETVGWQEALSVYRNKGKADALLRFLDAADFENITSDMVDEIIQCENSSRSNEAQKTSELKANNGSILLGQKRKSNTIHIPNKILPRISDQVFRHNDVDHRELIQNEVDTDTTGSDLMITEDRMELLSSRTESPQLHLSLGFIRSPGSSHLSSRVSLLEDSNSSLDHEEKIQQRRREIRVWIKKQRQKRKEQAKSNLSLTFTKPQRTANKTPSTSRGRSGMPNEVVHNVSPENLGLTGKQLQERSQDREVKRAKQRESHHGKREADIAKLLYDHKEEVAIYQSHVKPKPSPQSPSTLIKRRKLQTLKSWHPRSLQGSVSQKKPGLNSYFKNSTEDWRKRQQHTLVDSPHSQDSSGERGKHCVEQTSIENSTSLQMELYYLKRCLDNKNKDKHKTGLWSKDKQETSLDQAHYHTLLPKEKYKAKESCRSHLKLTVSKERAASSSVTRESSSRHSLPLSATFTLPLDRISEVASNVSETSLEGQQEVEGATLFVPAGEDTSTDSSWTVPEEVKNLLYNSQ